MQHYGVNNTVTSNVFAKATGQCVTFTPGPPGKFGTARRQLAWLLRHRHTLPMPYISFHATCFLHAHWKYSRMLKEPSPQAPMAKHHQTRRNARATSGTQPSAARTAGIRSKATFCSHHPAARRIGTSRQKALVTSAQVSAAIVTRHCDTPLRHAIALLRCAIAASREICRHSASPRSVVSFLITSMRVECSR